MALNDYLLQKPTLETPRLIMRTMQPDDVAALKTWMPDKALYTYWGKAMGKCDKNPELLFCVPPRKTKSFHWGIAHKDENKVIGEIWVYQIENNRMAKVAFRVATKYQGQGLASEALKGVVQFCFHNTELQRLWSDVDVRNTASCRVLQNAGFKHEGLVRQGKMVSTWCDYHLYAILKEDYAEGDNQA